MRTSAEPGGGPDTSKASPRCNEVSRPVRTGADGRRGRPAMLPSAMPGLTPMSGRAPRLGGAEKITTSRVPPLRYVGTKNLQGSEGICLPARGLPAESYHDHGHHKDDSNYGNPTPTAPPGARGLICRRQGGVLSKRWRTAAGPPASLVTARAAAININAAARGRPRRPGVLLRTCQVLGAGCGVRIRTRRCRG